MKQIFVDTAGFLALMDAKLEIYHKAVAVFDELYKTGCGLITTDYILDEVFTWMRCKKKMPVAEVVRFANGLNRGDVTVVNVEKNIFGHAFEMMVRYDDQYFSFTDCVSFAVMKNMKIKNVVTTDKHFAIAGFNNLLIK